ncbi:MAG: polysaccharide biosynthesis/export family protein [Phycisphaerales bacterium]|nr:polysaccharide biosynthesis/export family protein [Phycisphaerales bacterium]
MTNRKRFCTSFVLLSAAMLGTGCSQTNHWTSSAPAARPAELYQPFGGNTYIPQLHVERPPYRLNVGDVLEIIYQFRSEVSDKPYRLKIEDRIRIVFPHQEKYNQELTVTVDGHIRCLLIGQVRAAGITAEELEQHLKSAYSRYLKEPELTVVVDAANVKIKELRKAITGPRGQARLVPVKADGTVDLPYVGFVDVAGKTTQQLKELLDRRYKEEDLHEVAVTVQVLEFAGKKIYVHGEVRENGVIQADTPVTLIQAIIQKGGINPRGDKSKILLVRRKHRPVPQAIVFDLDSILSAQRSGPYGLVPDGSAFRHDIYLADGDIIYVPSTKLAQANDWIDQVFTRGIRAIFPYYGFVGLDFGYEIRNLRSGTIRAGR